MSDVDLSFVAQFRLTIDVGEEKVAAWRPKSIDNRPHRISVAVTELHKLSERGRVTNRIGNARPPRQSAEHRLSR